MTKKAGIMKIHNYSTQPPHEKVRTRSVVNREAQETNGTVRTVVGGASNKTTQQQQQQQKPAAQKAGSSPAANLSPELENTANRLTVEEADKQETAEPVEETYESQEEEEDVVVEEEQEEVATEGDEDQPTGGVKRRRVESSTQSVTEEQQVETNEEVVVSNHNQEPEVLEQTTQQQQHQGEENERTEEEEEEQTETDCLVEDLNEDDRTSSSTVSAEETLDQVMESFNKGRTSTINNLKRERGVVNSSNTSSGVIDPLTMTMDDYQQQQHQQQQQQQQDDAPMEEYEPAVSASASDDIEDADGALAGSRIFRKKVKRKLPVRPNSNVMVGGGGASAGTVTMASSATTDSSAAYSAKAKLQMVHEFPMLFLGLRRNRMFLVNSLAQWFDLKQRDIILTLRKIKQNESSVRLGSVFGIGSTEVELLFHTNVPKIADCLRNFIVWPDDITMKLNVPISLRQHFQRIHLILNYLVVRVKQNAVQELPPEEMATSFCPNEQCHKLKYLVASTLDGCVCFVSRAFGVQTDDELVLSQSGFLTKFKTNTNLIAGKNFHNFEDQLANGHDHTNNNNGRRNRGTSGGSRSADGDDDLERVLGGTGSNSNSVDNFEDIVSEKISKSKTFKLKNYIENILENFQSHQLLSPQTCIDGRTLKLLDDIVVIVGALINLQKQEIE